MNVSRSKLALACGGGEQGDREAAEHVPQAEHHHPRRAAVPQHLARENVLPRPGRFLWQEDGGNSGGVRGVEGSLLATQAPLNLEGGAYLSGGTIPRLGSFAVDYSPASVLKPASGTE